MAVARTNILQRIEIHGEDQQYSLLSLCRTPLLTIPHDLATNIRSISFVESALNAALSDWRQFLQSEDHDLETGPNDSYGLTADIFKHSGTPMSLQTKISKAGADASILMSLYTELTQEQSRLKVLFMEEAVLIGQEDEHAARKKHDYTPIIYKSIKTMAEKGVLKQVILDN